jgi:hypothetical protein
MMRFTRLSQKFEPNEGVLFGHRGLYDDLPNIKWIVYSVLVMDFWWWRYMTMIDGDGEISTGVDAGCNACKSALLPINGTKQ